MTVRHGGYGHVYVDDVEVVPEPKHFLWETRIAIREVRRRTPDEFWERAAVCLEYGDGEGALQVTTSSSISGDGIFGESWVSSVHEELSDLARIRINERARAALPVLEEIAWYRPPVKPDPVIAPCDLGWVQDVKTFGATDPAVQAVLANPGWRLLSVGLDDKEQTTLTFGWPAPGGAP
jgi:hypothetical protein